MRPIAIITSETIGPFSQAETNSFTQNSRDMACSTLIQPRWGCMAGKAGQAPQPALRRGFADVFFAFAALAAGAD